MQVFDEVFCTDQLYLLCRKTWSLDFLLIWYGRLYSEWHVDQPPRELCDQLLMLWSDQSTFEHHVGLWSSLIYYSLQSQWTSPKLTLNNPRPAIKLPLGHIDGYIIWLTYLYRLFRRLIARLSIQCDCSSTHIESPTEMNVYV